MAVKKSEPKDKPKVDTVETLKEKLSELRRTGNHLFRCAVLDLKDNKIIHEQKGDICSASYMSGATGRYEGTRYQDILFGLVYNGEKQEKGAARGPVGILSGGEVSMAWLKFILDPIESPWRDAVPAVSNLDDLEWINETGGIIFKDFNVGGNAFGGLVIASRFAQEHNNKAQFWFDMVKSGLHPRLAFIMACTCNAAGTAVHLDGHTPLSSNPMVWAKLCWELKADVGPLVSASGFTGGNRLYVNVNSPAYNAYYGYNNKSNVIPTPFGNFDKVLDHMKKECGID